MSVNKFFSFSKKKSLLCFVTTAGNRTFCTANSKRSRAKLRVSRATEPEVCGGNTTLTCKTICKFDPAFPLITYVNVK